MKSTSVSRATTVCAPGTSEVDSAASYGRLNGLARQRVKTKLIGENWDDMLRVAGSLKMGTISASEIIRSLS